MWGEAAPAHCPSLTLAFVFQLLNQFENTGPPPADKEKIQALPTIPVTKEHVGVCLLPAFQAIPQGFVVSRGHSCPRGCRVANWADPQGQLWLELQRKPPPQEPGPLAVVRGITGYLPHRLWA